MSRTRRFLSLVVAAAVTLPAGAARGQDDAGKIGALIRDLKDPTSERAYTAAQELGKYPQYRTQIVPALIEAITAGDWQRCAGDARDAIAWNEDAASWP